MKIFGGNKIYEKTDLAPLDAVMWNSLFDCVCACVLKEWAVSTLMKFCLL